MLKLTDGRNHLYQWDTGRKAEVTLQCDEVHFFNISRGTAISIKVTDGVVSIPDELLRSGVDIRYWAFVGTVESGYTMRGGRIEVVKRPKPSDYIYTETEVVSIETAVKNALEKAKESGDFPECDVTSVNGQTGDVQTRLLVTITENEDGTYTSSHTSQEIYAASQAGAVIEGANFNGRRYQTYICSEQVVQFLTTGVSGGSGKRSLNTYVFLIKGDKVIQSITQTPIPVDPAPMVGATASAAGTAGLVPKPAAGDQGKYLKGDGTWANIDCVQNPNTAAVGQTIVVKSVDENGKPTEWEAADFEEKWELIVDVTFEEETKRVEYIFDNKLKKLRVIVDTLAAEANTNYSMFTVEFPCEAGSVYYAEAGNIQPYPIPRTSAMRSVYDIETYYVGDVPFVDITTAINGTYPDTSYINKYRLDSLVNRYDGKMMIPKIHKFHQTTYGTFAAGTRYRIYGVRA